MRIAQTMNRAGHNVAVVSPSAAFLEQIKGVLVTPDTDCTVLPCDVNSAEAVTQTLGMILEKYTKIHTFVHTSLDIGPMQDHIVELIKSAISGDGGPGCDSTTLNRRFVNQAELDAEAYEVEASSVSGLVLQRVEGEREFAETERLLLDPPEDSAAASFSKAATVPAVPSSQPAPPPSAPPPKPLPPAAKRVSVKPAPPPMGGKRVSIKPPPPPT
jgi:hypothetical protein